MRSLEKVMGVSKNKGFSPQIIHFNRVFPLFSPSILVVKSPYFWVDTQMYTNSNWSSGAPLAWPHLAIDYKAVERINEKRDKKNRENEETPD